MLAPADFHRDPRYGGDLHRADLAWARHAAAMGLAASEIRTAIMEARDLAKKGSPSREREYAERTGNPAIWHARIRTAEDLEAEAARIEFSPTTVRRRA